MEEFNLQKFLKSKITKDELTEEEFNAVYRFVDENQDDFASPFKEGLLKLINNEMHERM
jgi:hypothetical protein